MSRYIATAAIRGANRIVKEADDLLQKSLEELGPETPIEFVNTGYHLPVVLAFTGDEVNKLGDLHPVIERAKGLLHPVPKGDVWLPYRRGDPRLRRGHPPSRRDHRGHFATPEASNRSPSPA